MKKGSFSFLQRTFLEKILYQRRYNSELNLSKKSSAKILGYHSAYSGWDKK